MHFNFTIILDLIGTFAFAISGIRLAFKQFDWFGAYIVGLVTAIGGGTTRDLLLGVTPFWMLDSMYFLTTGIALIATILFRDRVFKWGKPLFLFDAIGLGLFTIVGITKSLEAGLPVCVCIVMGTITGSVGGVIRDVLVNEVPLLFRKDIYALACVAGGLIYFACVSLNLPLGATEIIEDIENGIPLGHFGEPMDVAWGILYLASDESKYVTGIELTIDCGILAGSEAKP